MSKVTIANDVAQRIRGSEGPVELVDANGETIGVVRRPPTAEEIERARSRASQDGKRLAWAEVVSLLNAGANQ